MSKKTKAKKAKRAKAKRRAPAIPPGAVVVDMDFDLKTLKGREDYFGVMTKLHVTRWLDGLEEARDKGGQGSRKWILGLWNKAKDSFYELHFQVAEDPESLDEMERNLWFFFEAMWNTSVELYRIFVPESESYTEEQVAKRTAFNFTSHCMVKRSRVVLQVDSDVAISLMLTDIKREAVSSCVLPWPAVEIELPPDLIRLDHVGTFAKCIRVFSGWVDDGGKQVKIWQMSTVVDAGTTSSVFGEAVAIHDMCEEAREGYSVRPHVKAAFLLVVGLCVMAAEKPDFFEKKQTPYRNPKRVMSDNAAGLPVPQLYFANPAGLWGDDEKADGDENRKYLESRLNGKEYRTQRWLTRGHWRRQACGKERKDHKMVRIAPYWNVRRAEGAESTEA